jgi:molybdopterin molybdotransferase
MQEFITFRESQNILNSLSLPTPATRRLFLSDALGFILAEDIIAQQSSPAYPTSAMDGYAICYEDMQKDSIKILRDNPAGEMVETWVQSGGCIKTFTGSLMPKGSDTLVPIENVEVEGESIRITTPVDKGFAVRAVGENFEKGEVLVTKGSRIGYAEIGVMASLDIAQVDVYKRPVVAVLSSGSEILDLAQPRQNEAQIRSSNHITLEALAKSYGAEVVQLGVVEDDKASITEAIQNALKQADIVVTTGGVSVGDYDFVKDVVRDEIGAKPLFKGVKLKPGQHLMFARKDEQYIISLPGFAYSSTVTFLLYAVPVIARMQGGGYEPAIVDAVLEEDFSKPEGKTSYHAVNVRYERGAFRADFKGKKSGSSAILTNMLNSAGLLIAQPETTELQAGEKVQVLLIN